MHTWPALWKEPKLRPCDRLLKIGILQHNQCGVAGQLQVHPLEQSSREPRHLPTGVHRPGEGDDGNIGVGDEFSSDVAATGKDVEDIVGRPASSSRRAKATPPQTAVRGSGLSTTALPTASAGASARAASMRGALKGAMTPTTSRA